MLSNNVGYRSYRRVKNPSRSSLSDVVLDASTASDVMGFSPYSPITDFSGADPIAKVDTFSDVVPTGEVALPPLGAPTVYDSLLGLQLTEDQIWQVFDAVKGGMALADIALTYEISQQQVSDIYTAILNGATPNDILNPQTAQFQTAATLPARTMSDIPVDANAAPAMLPGGLTMFATAVPQALDAATNVQNTVPDNSSSGISPMMIGIGALAALFLFKE